MSAESESEHGNTSDSDEVEGAGALPKKRVLKKKKVKPIMVLHAIL